MGKSVFRLALLAAALIASCGGSGGKRPQGRVVVATYSALGAVVKDLVGDSFEVRVAVPNGLDVHEWEPSAKDIESFNKADLVVENGLDLEGGMGKTLADARDKGVAFFTASDYVSVRTVGAGEGIPSGDRDQAAGARDPHLWTDPSMMKAVAAALADRIKKDFGVDLSNRLADLGARLDALDAEIKTMVAGLPPKDRKLVTGHESLGYFARRYGFRLVGAVVPSLTTEAESSASDIVTLKKLIADNGVKVLFVESGTPERVVKALAAESRVTAVPLATHVMPKDGSYFTFMRNLAGDIVRNLGGGKAP